MIEFKFTGNSLEEIQESLFATANVIAQGRQLQQMIASGQTKQQAQIDEAKEKLAAANKKTKKTDKPEPVVETKPAEPEADSAEEAVEKAEAVPSTIDELRALAMKAMDKIGNDQAKKIIAKYGAKLSEIPKDKIGECGKEFLKAMDI